jgi:hypothetical protein
MLDLWQANPSVELYRSPPKEYHLMGTLYRRKYLVLRHWLFQNYQTDFARFKFAEEGLNGDLRPTDSFTSRRRADIGTDSQYQYRDKFVSQNLGNHDIVSLR